MIKHGNPTKSQSMVNQNTCRPENKYKNEQNQMTDKSNQSSKFQTRNTDLMKNIKFVEFRNKEAKLKKWEEDLKLNDKIYSEQKSKA